MSELDQQIQVYRKAYKILAKKIKRREIEEKVKELIIKKLKRNQAAQDEKNDAANSSDDEVQEQRKETKRKEILNIYNCKVCETNYRTEENLRLHEKTHMFGTKKKWSCGTCLYNFLTEARLKLHKCRGKDGSDDELVCLDQLYSCKDCFAAYKKQEDLVEHRKVNHLTNYVCNICSKSFMFKVAFDKHLLVHVQTKEFHCKLCNKICKTESALKAHNVVHRKDILNVALSALKSNRDVGKRNEKSLTSSHGSTFPKPKRVKKSKQLSDGSDIEEVEPNTVEVPTFNLECVDGNDSNESTDFHSINSVHQDDTDTSVTDDISTLNKTPSSQLPTTTNFQPVVKVLKLPALENTSNTLPITLAVPVHLNLGDKKPKCQLCYETFNTKEELIDHIEIHLGRRIELRSNPRTSTDSSMPCISLGHDQVNLMPEETQFPKKKKNRTSKSKVITNKKGVKKINNKPVKTNIPSNTVPKKKRGRPAKSVKINNAPKTFEGVNEMINTQTLRGISEFTKENTVFDPNYIIKVEPEDTQDLGGEIDLDATFIMVEKENGSERVKLSHFIQTMKKPIVDLSLYNI